MLLVGNYMQVPVSECLVSCTLLKAMELPFGNWKYTNFLVNTC